MCGITGYWSASQTSGVEDVLRAMGAAIAHRGPDSAGISVEAEYGIAFAHQRLAIQDISSAGHQPMQSADNRFLMVFNGEIYNHQDIRKLLVDAGYSVSWRGRSDTETVLAAIEVWGIEKTLEHLNGMFALVVFDKTSKKLYCARDRMGEKPLFISKFEDHIIFGSELSALRAHPKFEASLNREALRLFMANSNVPAPYCIYNNVVKLEPGHLMTIESPDLALPDSRPFWSVSDAVKQGFNDKAVGTDEELIDQLEEKIHDSVARRLVSDVPLGAFLSGGYDSSLIVAMMQKISSTPVKTFTIGFNEQGFDEAPFAKEVASHLKTEHTELYLRPDEAMEVIPTLPRVYDEPFADSSQIPTILVSKLARESVTVSLSGDGGDELFGGYARYQDAPRIAQKLSKLPSAVRAPLVDVGLFGVSTVLKGMGKIPGEKLKPIEQRLLHAERLKPLLKSKNCMDVFASILTNWNGLSVLNEAPPVGFQKANIPDSLTELQQMMFHDGVKYLPDTIMTKVDRASMSVGLESRAPMLDHNLVEFAWSLSDNMRIRDGQGKWLMRQVLHRHVPKAMMDRPKAGFGVPIDQWLRGPLKEWAEKLIDKERLSEQGIFNTELVHRAWDEHQSRRWDWHYPIWNVLMFQAWYELYPDLTVRS